ncbi:M24 family metallopeptidase [Pseudomonas fluorescens]|uniref:M24 family metallopeptidase n=1 Tax=Pseudomonas fluorescens TaxID=294 RepID=UPI001908B9E2|nr:M24 family metallopeptidase [Pseudomonas fluorescens]MBD8089845.1 M24 family metallopeptidase [Pseudomonas fluorescens]MBD8717145.1 M24 family metallopeptidase [Pseudomonas fluorescens]
MLLRIGILPLLFCVNAYAADLSLTRYTDAISARAHAIAQLDDATILAEETKLAPMASDLLLKVGPMIRKGGTGTAVQGFLLEQYAQHGWLPMMFGFRGYPAAVGVSVNNQVSAAPPTDAPFPDAALVKVELIAASAQAHVAQVWTFATADATPAQRQLLATARRALANGVAHVQGGQRLSNVGAAIQQELDAGQAVAVREFAGYAMGQARIQKPQVLGYKVEGDSPLMQPGQVLNVYVIAKAGTVGVRYQPPDFWSLLSSDGADGVMLSAMVEVTADGHRLLSRMLD